MGFLYDAVSIYNDVHIADAPHQNRGKYREMFTDSLVFKSLLLFEALAPGYAFWPWAKGRNTMNAASRSFLAMDKIYQRFNKRSHIFLTEDLNNIPNHLNNGTITPQEADALRQSAAQASEYMYFECAPDRFIHDTIERGHNTDQDEQTDMATIVGQVLETLAQGDLPRGTALESAHLWYFDKSKFNLMHHIEKASRNGAHNEPSAILLRLLHPGLSRDEAVLFSFALLVRFMTKYPQLFAPYNHRNDAVVQAGFDECLLTACGVGKDAAKTVTPESVMTAVNVFWNEYRDKGKEKEQPGMYPETEYAQRAVLLILDTYNECMGKTLYEILQEIRSGCQSFARCVSGALQAEASAETGWNAYFFLADSVTTRMHSLYEVCIRKKNIQCDDDFFVQEREG